MTKVRHLKSVGYGQSPEFGRNKYVFFGPVLITFHSSYINIYTRGGEVRLLGGGGQVTQVRSGQVRSGQVRNRTPPPILEDGNLPPPSNALRQKWPRPPNRNSKKRKKPQKTKSRPPLQRLKAKMAQTTKTGPKKNAKNPKRPKVDPPSNALRQKWPRPPLKSQK